MRCVVSCSSTSFQCFYSSLELCCEGPWFTSIQEDGCDKGAHQSYLGAKRNIPVIPNWFQPCQCCCCLCYPGEYLRLGTLISYNWAQVLEACDSLKLLSIYFDLCVDATGVVSLTGIDLRTDAGIGLCRSDGYTASLRPYVYLRSLRRLPFRGYILLQWQHQKSYVKSDETNGLVLVLVRRLTCYTF